MAANTRTNKAAKNSLSDSQKSEIRKVITRVVKADLEKGELDTNQNASSVDFSGSLWDLTVIAQGSGNGQRVNDELTLESIECKMNAGGADTTNLMRVILVQYFPQNAPTVGTIFQNSGSGAGPISQFRKDTFLDYRVLWDNYYNPSSGKNKIGLVLSTSSAQREWAFTIRGGFRPKLLYNTAATTGNNHVYLMAISDSGAVPNPTLSFNARVTYLDG